MTPLSLLDTSRIAGDGITQPQRPNTGDDRFARLFQQAGSTGGPGDLSGLPVAQRVLDSRDAATGGDDGGDPVEPPGLTGVQVSQALLDSLARIQGGEEAERPAIPTLPEGPIGDRTMPEGPIGTLAMPEGPIGTLAAGPNSPTVVTGTTPAPLNGLQASQALLDSAADLNGPVIPPHDKPESGLPDGVTGEVRGRGEGDEAPTMPEFPIPFAPETPEIPRGYTPVNLLDLETNLAEAANGYKPGGLGLDV